MKKGKFYFVSYSVVVLIFLFIIRCSKDTPDDIVEKENRLPICKIVNPIDAEEYYYGDPITVSVEANDLDGEIEEVRFFIDNVGVSSTKNFPYNFVWQTAFKDIGDHRIKVEVYDNSNEKTSKEIAIKINDYVLIDSRDGQSYRIVKIGNQYWMSENLNYHGDNSDYNSVYGELFWSGSVGEAPDGWHVSTTEDWEILSNYLGGNLEAGGKLKAVNELWITPNTRATDEVGFCALPGGGINGLIGLHSVGEKAYFWIGHGVHNSNSGNYERQSVIISFDSGALEFYYSTSWNVSKSIRCVKD